MTPAPILIDYSSLERTAVVSKLRLALPSLMVSLVGCTTGSLPPVDAPPASLDLAVEVHEGRVGSPTDL